MRPDQPSAVSPLGHSRRSVIRAVAGAIAGAAVTGPVAVADASSRSASRFEGRLLLPGEEGFAPAVFGRVFNQLLPRRQPAALLQAATENDVVRGVRLAIERGWQVAVRAGGHSWPVWSVRDHALLIDLGDIREMTYHPDTGTVSVSPAITGGDELNPYLQQFGRFFAGGHCPSVGLGGFLLQGGHGWNARGWGWAAEQVVAVDVVTAAGQLVRADPHRHTDLFWAARGAGPGFPGIVTRFHLRTRAVPQGMANTVQAYPIGLFDQVMTWLHDTHQGVSPLVEIVALTRTPTEPIPGHEGGPILMVTGLAMTDTLDQGRSALAPLHANPYADRALFRVEAAPTTLAEQNAMQRQGAQPGRWLADNAWLHGSARRVVPALRTAMTQLPTPESHSIWLSMAPRRELAPHMALSMQSEIYTATYVMYQDPARDVELRQWLTGAMNQMLPVTVGQYLGDSDFTARQLKFMGSSQWSRLQRIQAIRDPRRLFAGYLTATGAPPTNTNPVWR